MTDTTLQPGKGVPQLDAGALVELIEHPTDPYRTLLAFLKDGYVQCAAEVKVGGHRVFASSRVGLLQSLTLAPPDGCDLSLPLPGATSPEALLQDVQELISSSIATTFSEKVILAAFVLNTWIADHLPFCPYLVLQGPPQSGKSTVLLTLSLLCRQALPAADITIPGMLDACTRFSPTLLIDDFDEIGRVVRASFLRLIRSGNTRGAFAVHGRAIRHAYGPKVIAAARPIADAALSSRCARIALYESHDPDLLDLRSPQVQARARNLRARLLRFRLTTAPSLVPRPRPGEARLRARTRDLFRCLAAPFSSAETISSIRNSLEHCLPHNEPQLSPIQRALLSLLFDTLHLEPNCCSMDVVELARRLNQELESDGQRMRCEARKIGWELREFGLVPMRMNRGFVLHFGHDVVMTVHDLARRYLPDLRLSTLPSEYEITEDFDCFRRCALCREYQIVPTPSAPDDYGPASDTPPVDGARADSETDAHA